MVLDLLIVLALLVRMELLAALGAEAMLAFGACSPVHLFLDVSWLAAELNRAPSHIIHLVHGLSHSELVQLGYPVFGNAHLLEVTLGDSSLTLFLAVTETMCSRTPDLIYLTIVD